MNEEQTEEQKLKQQENTNTVRTRLTMWAVIATLMAIAPWLALDGKYGATLFVTIPFSVGMLFALLKSINRKNTFWELLLIMIFPITFMILAFLIFGKEGFVCILMAIPIVVAPMIIGVLTGYLIQNFYWSKYMAVIFIFILNSSMYVYDTKKVSDFETVEIVTSITIHAPKEKVWEKLTKHFEFGNANSFFLEHGVSYPMSMELKNSNGCNSLICQYSNGNITGKIDSLVPDTLMRFSFSDAPVSMKETSLYSDVEPKHIRGRVVINYGSFRIVPKSNGTVEVIATSEFRSSLAPHFYWNWWGGYLVNKMHQHVLEKIKEQSEGTR